jgi:hypothetical protein
MSVTVAKGLTTTSLSSTSLSLLLGQLVTFTAVVTPSAPAVGVPGGTLKFKDGGAVLATVNVSPGGTQFGTTSLVLGVRSITAAYQGDAHFQTSTSPKITITVSP